MPGGIFPENAMKDENDIPPFYFLRRGNRIRMGMINTGEQQRKRFAAKRKAFHERRRVFIQRQRKYHSTMSRKKHDDPFYLPRRKRKDGMWTWKDELSYQRRHGHMGEELYRGYPNEVSTHWQSTLEPERIDEWEEAPSQKDDFEEEGAEEEWEAFLEDHKQNPTDDRSVNK